MPEITMCSNNRCLLRDKCYRYRAIPNTHNQRYEHFHYFSGQGKPECTYFWDTRDYLPSRLRETEDVDLYLHWNPPDLEDNP